jgi:ELWxxDGT repeat protein
MKIFTFLLIGIGLFFYSVSAQTKLVKDINPGAEDGVNPVASFESVLYKGKIFFCAGVSTSNQELWTSDGTNDGTKLVKDLIVGSSGTPRNFKIFQDTLFFEDWQGNYWKSDGTTDNTIKLNTKFPYWKSQGAGFSKDLFLDAIVGGYWDKDWIVTKDRNGNIVDTLQQGSSICNTIVYKGNLYFFGTRKVVYIGYTEYEYFLSKTDGTRKGTEVILDELPEFDPQIVIVNNKLLFNLPNKINGIEPYISDGTKDGTKLLFDINPDADNSSPFGFISNGKIALFTAYEGIHGSSVWRTDGTTEGTYLLYDWFNNNTTEYRQAFTSIKKYYIDTLFYLNIAKTKTIVSNGKNFAKELLLGLDYGGSDILENLSTSKSIIVHHELFNEYDKYDYKYNSAYFKVFGIDPIYIYHIHLRLIIN